MPQKKKLEKYFTTFHLSLAGLFVAFVLTFVFKYLDEAKTISFVKNENPINQMTYLSCPQLNQVALQNGKYICKQVISRFPDQVHKVTHVEFLSESLKKQESAEKSLRQKLSNNNKESTTNSFAAASVKVISQDQVNAVINEKCHSFDSYLKEVSLDIKDLPFSRISERDLRVIVKNNNKIYKATLVATCAKESLSLQEICEQSGHPIVSEYLRSPALKKFLVNEEKVNEQKRTLASINDFEMQGRLVEVAFNRAMRVCKQLDNL